ncbi:MAG: AraC family transcriptional regulator ligand-binding domain-containing protein [Rhodospirillales bacterium]|nr:AraC family transcriptional regulator ligand-binding domain-containing protein [Rhodospirillales bacterium]
MPGQAITLARAGALAPFVDFLDEVGAPYGRFLESARLSPDLFADPSALFPLRQGMRFIDAAAHSQGIDDIGLVVGRRTGITGLLPLGGLISPQQTLDQAIAVLIRGAAWFNPGARLSLACRGDRAFFRHSIPTMPHREAHLFSLMVMIDVVRLAAGPRWQPIAVYLPRGEQGRSRAYEALLGAPCHRGTDCWTLVFDKDLLAQTLRFARSASRSSDEIMAGLQRTAPAGDFEGSLRQLIASMLSLGAPTLNAVAEAGGLSPRTLQRRLSECGRTYSDLVEDARFDAAKRLLRRNDLRIVDIALELGYSDAANFTRAFRRWSGSAPRTARISEIRS